MDSSEVAYAANTDGKTCHYICIGASSHFVNEIEALHDYIPFEAPTSTAEDETMQGFRTGTLQFTSQIDGNEVKGELKNVYYTPDSRHRLISVSKFFAQGREPQLSHNGPSVVPSLHLLSI